MKEEMELEEYSKVDFPKILINEDDLVLTTVSVASLKKAQRRIPYFLILSFFVAFLFAKIS